MVPDAQSKHPPRPPSRALPWALPPRALPPRALPSRALPSRALPSRALPSRALPPTPSQEPSQTDCQQEQDTSLNT